MIELMFWIIIMMWITPIVLAIKDYEAEALCLGSFLMVFTLALVLVMCELYLIS